MSTMLIWRQNLKSEQLLPMRVNKKGAFRVLSISFRIHRIHETNKMITQENLSCIIYIAWKITQFIRIDFITVLKIEKRSKTQMKVAVFLQFLILAYVSMFI
jgi:hypothetical protein